MEFTLLWAALTGVALGWLGLRLWPDRLPDHAADRLIAAGLGGLVAGRLTAMISQGVNPILNPGDFIIIRGGVHTGAAGIVFIATLLWTTRTTKGALDALAPAALLALVGWHGGCVWREACLGTQSDLPWAWALEGSLVTRHPVEIYAAIGLAAGTWLVSAVGWRPWLRAGLALSIASGIRLLTEPMRPSISGGPTGWYLAGVLVGVAIILFAPSLNRSLDRAPT